MCNASHKIVVSHIYIMALLTAGIIKLNNDNKSNLGGKNDIFLKTEFLRMFRRNESCYDINNQMYH